MERGIEVGKGSDALFGGDGRLFAVPDGALESFVVVVVSTLFGGYALRAGQSVESAPIGLGLVSPTG